MFETPITVVGRIVTDPRRRIVGDQEVISFRVASNPAAGPRRAPGSRVTRCSSRSTAGQAGHRGRCRPVQRVPRLSRWAPCTPASTRTERGSSDPRWTCGRPRWAPDLGRVIARIEQPPQSGRPRGRRRRRTGTGSLTVSRTGTVEGSESENLMLSAETAGRSRRSGSGATVRRHRGPVAPHLGMGAWRNSSTPCARSARLTATRSSSTMSRSSFLPGAKIGVVGPNGAGKSSVLRIMAGLDQPNNGDAFLAPGATVGILQQEPRSTRKTVRGNVEEARRDQVKLDRFNEVAELMATDYSDELMEEMGRLQEELDHANAWDLDSQLEQAMDALRCPPPDEPVTHLSGGERRRVALCKLLLSKPDLLLLLDGPPTTSTRRVCGGSNSTSPNTGCDSGRHPRPVLPGQRRRVDPELDRGRAYPTRATTDLPGEEGRAPRGGQEEGPSCKRLRRNWPGCVPGPRRQAKNKAVCSATRRWRPRRKTRKLDFEEIPDPGRPAAGRGRRGRAPGQGLRRAVLIRTSRSPCRATASSG